MKNLLISFCITTFERYEILEELILSILSVDSDQFEIVVCDDCSTDNSIEKLKNICDKRLKVYVNKKRLGALQNMYEAFEHGIGEYLFFANDRDNVDSFKIEKLMTILEELKEKNVAFAKCLAGDGIAEKYHIFKEGKDSLIRFACRIDHPTGYIFKREIWKKIKNRRLLFDNEDYGDYPFTLICALMALKYSGALIYGNICDVMYRRIDFAKEKSRYHWRRKHKRLWYFPETILRELKIGQKFLKKIGVQKDIREQILVSRYAEGLFVCVTDYKNEILDSVCTTHYNFYPHQDFFHVFATSLWNGIKLWSGTVFLSDSISKKVFLQINRKTKQEYAKYLRNILESNFHNIGKKIINCEKKDYEIYRREELLITYESWLDIVIDQKMISDYLWIKGYHHVAIYGMGRIGRNLWKEFQNSNIQVEYVIDRKLGQKSQYYENVRCYDISSDLPYVDIIIVTIPSETESITAELRKNVKWRIKSIKDLLFVVS